MRDFHMVGATLPNVGMFRRGNSAESEMLTIDHQSAYNCKHDHMAIEHRTSRRVSARTPGGFCAERWAAGLDPSDSADGCHGSGTGDRRCGQRDSPTPVLHRGAKPLRETDSLPLRGRCLLYTSDA